MNGESPPEPPFTSIRWLRNHWSRPAGPRRYYWYLTFGNSPELHDLVAESQKAIGFPYYDLVAPEDLHLTLDRIGPEAAISPARLDAIAAAASRACQSIPPFRITLGPLGATRGAIGFDVSPAHAIRELRGALRGATLSACPGASVTPQDAPPHITIAYANTDGVPAAEAIAAVGKLNAAGRTVEVPVSEAVMVLLQRRERSYAWQPVTRIRLTGTASLEPADERRGSSGGGGVRHLLGEARLW
jgi:2'-5' RNA ligase